MSCARRGGRSALGTGKFTSELDGLHFDELRYFTNVTKFQYNCSCNAAFVSMDLRNIQTLQSAGDWKPFRLNVIYMPALVNSPNIPLGNYQNSVTNDTNVGIYLPALVSATDSSAFNFYWYGRGRMRWLVLGTDNGGHVVSIAGEPKFYMNTPPIGVFVPDDLVDTYKAHERWSAISKYFKPISQFETLTGETLPTID